METGVNALYLLLAAVSIAVGACWARVSARRTQERQRAERKVLFSDPILRSDIETLRRTKSLRFEEAIALRRSQLQSGRHPEATPRI